MTALGAFAHLMDEREPTEIERDRLRAAAKLLCRNVRRSLENGARILIDQPDWIA